MTGFRLNDGGNRLQVGWIRTHYAPARPSKNPIFVRESQQRDPTPLGFTTRCQAPWGSFTCGAHYRRILHGSNSSDHFGGSEDCNVWKARKVRLVEGDNLLKAVPLHSCHQACIVSAFTRNGEIGDVRKPIGKDTTFISKQNNRL